jgi:curved DNA-binding protein
VLDLPSAGVYNQTATGRLSIMEYKDYYTTLGVARTASADEIKRAYRKLAMQYHPDRNPGDRQAEEHFKDINEAYQVLSDREKRARYDQLGDSYSHWQEKGGPDNFDWGQWTAQQGAQGQQVDFNDLFGEGAFSDFFRSIFGGMGGGPRTVRGRSSRAAPAYQQPVAISLKEAFAGTSRLLQIGERRVEVRIPPGARTGTRVRVPGAGPAAAGGGATDLYLLLNVAEDPLYERQGDDLHTQVTIDIFKAMLGGEAEVHTMSGKVLLTIPPGTQPEQVFRVAGRGMPRLKKAEQKGDLYIHVKVQIPRQLNARQKALLEEAGRAK